VLNSSASPLTSSNAVPMSGFYLGAPLFIVLLYYVSISMCVCEQHGRATRVFIDGNTRKRRPMVPDDVGTSPLSLDA